MLYFCDISGDIFHEEDGFRTKDGFISLKGLYLFYNARFEYLKTKRIRNFFLFLFPYLFPITILILGIIQNIFNIPILFDWLALALMVAPIIIFGIGAKMFLSSKMLFQEIGDPERTVLQLTGTVDLENGAITATSRAYDEYSGTQWVLMLLNILLFIVALIVNVAVGWIYYLFYIIRRHRYKRLSKATIDKIVTLPPERLTMFFACEKEQQEGFQIYLVDQNNEYIDGDFKFKTTFYSENRLYTVFACANEENKVFMYEILPGYVPRLIDDDEEFEKVKKIWIEIISSDD